MMDHDQRFKSLIREFFAEFLTLFFAVWADRFDLGNIEWFDKEVLPNPAGGVRNLLDLVAKIKTKPQVGGANSEEPKASLALIHIEIESPDRTTKIKPRLPNYYVHLRETYKLPVLPIVIYLKVGLDGIGTDIYEENFWELNVLRFSYLYVGLPQLDALEYVQGDNWLGVALSALMRIPPEQVARLGKEALERLTEAPLTEQQKFLLAECVEAYLPLDEEQQREFERLMLGNQETKVKAMNKTTFEKGIEQGIEQGIEKGIVKGIEQGIQNTLLLLGEEKFGPPSNEIESSIRAIQNISTLKLLTKRILVSTSWNELL